MNQRRGTFVCMVGLLVMSGVIAQPLLGETITLTAGGANPTNINFISQLFIVPTNAASVWHNNTGVWIWDLHFIADRAQGQPLRSGGGGPWFGNIAGATNTTLNFEVGGTGTGMPPSTVFTITTANFLPTTVIRAHATVPEPSTVMLLGLGSAVLVGLGWRRCRRSPRASRVVAERAG